MDWLINRVGTTIGRFCLSLQSAAVLGSDDGGLRASLSSLFPSVIDSIGESTSHVDLVVATGDEFRAAMAHHACERSVFVSRCQSEQDAESLSIAARASGRSVERATSPSGDEWLFVCPSVRLASVGLLPSVHGWLTDDEAAWLSEAALSSRLAMEFGAWCGRSTVCLSAAETLVSVDTWLGTPLDPSTDAIHGGLRPIAEWRDNTAGLPGVIGIVGDLRSIAIQTLLTSAYRYSCDLLFVDANHAYPSVASDIRLARKLVRPGGILCGHDYSTNHPGVVRAVDEFVPGVSVACGTIWMAKV